MKIGSRGLNILALCISLPLLAMTWVTFERGGSMPVVLFGVLVLFVIGWMPRLVFRLVDRPTSERWNNELTAVGMVLGGAAAAAIIAFWSWPQT